MAKFDVGTWVWMADEEEMFLPAMVHKTAFTAGSADQVNFSQMANILERRVLAKRSQVKLLPDAVELADASAYTIFPELKEALGLIQKEVTERLLGMMREALE